jgi:DNA repair protein RecO (recombination protein O)
VKTVLSHALLLRTVAYGESDLIVTLLTETDGKLGARLRGGRKSSKRASGGIEPFHTIEATLEDRGGELLTLKECRLVTVRAGLVGSLEGMDAAGTVLRWARHLLPVRHKEPLAWATLVRLLDALDRGGVPPRGLLALSGLHLLASVGYALELERCVVCERPCPDGAPAFVDAARGGLVCRSCGGGGRVLDARVRALAARAQRQDDGEAEWLSPPDWLTATQTNDLLAILADAMAAHTGLDPSK